MCPTMAHKCPVGRQMDGQTDRQTDERTFKLAKTCKDRYLKRHNFIFVLAGFCLPINGVFNNY